MLHGEGPLLIIAGAGTGKTTVLTRRIAHLIATKRAKPEEILALTFTEKAAAEMAERVDQLIPYGYAETQIATFHAFGDSRPARVRRSRSASIREFRVLSQPEQVIFLRERLFRLPLDRFRPLGDPTRHLEALADAREPRQGRGRLAAAVREWAEARRAAATTEERARRRRVATSSWRPSTKRTSGCSARPGSWTSATRSTALSLLRERPALLARLRARYAYILVDEFQDTNHAQLELRAAPAPATAPQHHRRRRRRPGHLPLARRGRRQPARLPRATTRGREVVLTENHRSTQVILDAAARLIRYNNPYRLEVVAGIDKRLRSRAAGRPARAPRCTSTPFRRRPTASPR